MKNNKGIVYKRQQQILQRLKDVRIVNVNDMAKELSVTPITIRRDLQLFEEQGLVNRFHGGATMIDGALMEDPALNGSDAREHATQKEMIAQCAASFVEDGDTIFINSSSTALMMIKYLKDKRVVVVTNNGKALTEDWGPTVELVLTGGEVYRRKQSMVGDLAAQALARIVADKSFLGVSGISAAHGITTSILRETAINEIMMKRCNGNCYILADSSKIGKQNNFSSGQIHLLHTLITDKDADPEELNKIRACGARVIQTDRTT